MIVVLGAAACSASPCLGATWGPGTALPADWGWPVTAWDTVLPLPSLLPPWPVFPRLSGASGPNPIVAPPRTSPPFREPSQSYGSLGLSPVGTADMQEASAPHRLQRAPRHHSLCEQLLSVPRGPILPEVGERRAPPPRQ